ncbi:Os01g0656600, partial [Oryza sativa Japonica Group]
AAKTDMYNELTVCQEEKNAALLQVQQLEANLKNLESELEQKQSQVSALEQANEELREKISSLERQLEEARSKLQDEIIKLQGEKERALDNLQQSNTSIKTFEEELEKQREHNSILQLANDDLHKSIANLEKELEDTKVSSHAEILALQEQKNKALSDLQQSEISIENFRMELEQGREKISILDLSNEEMKDNNYRLNQQLEEIRTSLHAEIAALHEEKDAAQLELQQSLASARNLETVLEKQTENLSTLQHANDNLKKNNCTLTEQFEVIKIELQEEVKMAHEEKDATLTQLEKSEDSIKNLESELAQLKEELSVQMESNSSLNKQLEEAILKVSNLTEELETVQAETASKINDMETNTKDLVNTIVLLSSQKNKVEEHMKIITEACMEKMSFMKDFEDQVKQKITDREIAIACLQQSLRGIIGSCQRLQYAYGEVSTKASHLEVLRRNHLVQIDTLENKHTEIMEKHRHLGEENTSANKENRKLQNHVQELEAQLQLARQKLRVTEAESKSKEDSYVMAVEKSHREIQYLEQKIQKYSGQINSLEETLVQIKGNAESGTSTLVDQLDQLESHFNKSFSHFSARSFACSEELKLLRNRLQHHLAEQKELVKKNDVLGMRLREKENVLSEMVRSASEAKKKMAHLEKTIDEKEEEISARVQEKREAIKQLSNAIIYHKNNSDDLIRYIRNHNRRRLPFCL